MSVASSADDLLVVGVRGFRHLLVWSSPGKVIERNELAWSSPLWLSHRIGWLFLLLLLLLLLL